MRPATWIVLAASLTPLVEAQCELHRLSTSGPSPDRFGRGAAITGNLAIVGAEYATGFGLVYVHDLKSGQPVFELAGGWSGSQFGYSVAADGDIAVVGMPGYWIGTGGAYAFDLRTGNILAIFELNFTGKAFGTEIGIDVDVDGHLAIIGTYSADAFVWDLPSGQPRRLAAPGMKGHHVAISGDLALVGHKSTAYVFDAISGKLNKTYFVPGIRDVDVEGRLALIGGPGQALVIDVVSDQVLHSLKGPSSFGEKVAIHRGRGIIASAGSALVFDLRSGQKLFRLAPSQVLPDGEFGRSVALGSAHALVGAPGEPFGDTDEVGAAYVFAVGDPVGTSYCGPGEANSTGRPAVVEASGSESAATNVLFLTAKSMPPKQLGAFLASRTQGFVQHPGGSQGNLCLGGAVLRLTHQFKSAGPTGCFRIEVDLTGLTPETQHAIQPGETWNFQAWYRDENPGPTSNFSDAVSVTFQ